MASEKEFSETFKWIEPPISRDHFISNSAGHPRAIGYNFMVRGRFYGGVIDAREPRFPITDKVFLENVREVAFRQYKDVSAWYYPVKVFVADTLEWIKHKVLSAKIYLFLSRKYSSWKYDREDY